MGFELLLYLLRENKTQGPTAGTRSNSKLDRARMLPATLAKADAFDASEAARRRREGAAGGGGRPAAAGRTDGEGSDEDDAEPPGGGEVAGMAVGMAAWMAVGMAIEAEVMEVGAAVGAGEAMGVAAAEAQAARWGLLVWDSNTSDFRLSVGRCACWDKYERVNGDHALWVCCVGSFHSFTPRRASSPGVPPQVRFVKAFTL